MGGLEAASLSVKLKYLDEWNISRKKIAKQYYSRIKNPEIKFQKIPSWSDGVYHLFVITTKNKQALVNHLIENNIIPAYHYPVPCHLQDAYSHLEYKKGAFPKAEYLAEHSISLPMYPELGDKNIDYIIDCLNSFSNANK
jgi:dTDP-4-amino-4,6-dideoxygalactose transaminase